MTLRKRYLVVVFAAALPLLGGLAALTASRVRGEAVAPRTTLVTISGKAFRLEIAATPQAHDRGLGGRTHLNDNGGMIFVFPEEEWQAFVMRDCPIPLDLLYLDGSGRVLALYRMAPEPPRTGLERADDEAGNAAYNARLTSYLSQGPARFAIELRGGTIAALGVRAGDRVGLDAAALPEHGAPGGEPRVSHSD